MILLQTPGSMYLAEKLSKIPAEQMPKAIAVLVVSFVILYVVVIFLPAKFAKWKKR